MPKYRIETITNEVINITSRYYADPNKNNWIRATDGKLINLNHAVTIEEIKSPLQIWEEN